MSTAIEQVNDLAKYKKQSHQPKGSVAFQEDANDNSLPGPQYQSNFTLYHQDHDELVINCNYPIKSQQNHENTQKMSQNYSIQFNSNGSKSARGYNSNYMLNEIVFSNDDGENDQFEGTMNNNHHELLELSRDLEQPIQVYTLTETEVREIVKRFNDSLNKHTLETGDLEKRTKTLINLIDDKEAVLRQMYKQRESIILEIENKDLQKEKAINQQQTLEIQRIEDLSMQQFSPQKGQSKSNLLQQLELKRNRLISSNEDLRNFITQKYNQQRLEEKKCQSCRLFFIPLNNSDESCRYHFGKLKFFSCRGCGSDQYYNCCNKCIICSPGCKTAKHIA